MTFTTITICALATYRLTRLIAVEEGPFGLALKLRGALDPDGRTWIGRGMACPWCISFWIAPVTLYAASYATGAIIVGGLAVSALVGLGHLFCGHAQMTIERFMRRR